jgi:ABC-type antimicrobial peptide transport system ATPase subunit
MIINENSLSASHQQFIEDLTALVDKAKVKIIDEFVKAFDVESVLSDPENGKNLMVELQIKLNNDYLVDAQEIGNKFGTVKREIFNGETSNSDT